MEVEFIKNLSGPWIGDARLYKLSKSIKFHKFDKEKNTNYIIISSVELLIPYNTKETYIFPADSNANILSWTELPGSYRGALDHEKAIKDFKEHYS